MIDRKSDYDLESEAICCDCGAECDYCPDVPENCQLCDQCACTWAGVCDACGGPCRGLAWPRNYTHVYPRWPV
jgi:hypothetical protein